MRKHKPRIEAEISGAPGIYCPNCRNVIFPERGCNEIMCHKCGLTIDLHGPVERLDDEGADVEFA